MSTLKQERRANYLCGLVLTSFILPCIFMIITNNIIYIYVFLAIVPITLVTAILYERRINRSDKQ